MATRKIVLVTGANQGIGYEIVKKILKQGSHFVVMACRSAERAAAAVNQLKAELQLGAEQVPGMISLDLSNIGTIETAVEEFTKKYGEQGQLTTLVNNAGVLYSAESKESEFEKAVATLAVNFTNTVAFTEKMLPLMTKGGSIVMVSSRLGALTELPGVELRKKLASEDLTLEALHAMAGQYQQLVSQGIQSEAGWPLADGYVPAYCVSKALLNAYVRITAPEMLSERSIFLNTTCPGWTQTRMTGGQGHNTPEQGAETPTWVAVDPSFGSGQHHGLFFGGMRRVRYYDGETVTEETIKKDSLVISDTKGPII